MTLQNTGWLPTYITRLARDKKLVRGIVVDIELPDEARLLQGDRRIDAGQLEGRAYKDSSMTGWAGQSCDTTDERVRVSWIIATEHETELVITAHHERAGRVAIILQLDSNEQTGPGDQD